MAGAGPIAAVIGCMAFVGVTLLGPGRARPEAFEHPSLHPRG